MAGQNKENETSLGHGLSLPVTSTLAPDNVQNGSMLALADPNPTPLSDISTTDSQYELVKGKTEVNELIEIQGQAGLDLENVEKRECGIGRCRPMCLQQCANIKMFVFAICVLSGVSSTLTVGYLNGVITTIEKRFEIGSTISGLIAASYEFGSLISVIFVSYLGSTRHIPKFIGVGVIFMGIGSYLFALPHFISKQYSTLNTDLLSNVTEENICRASSQNQEDLLATKCVDEGSGNWVYVLILIAAQIMIGSGSTPIYTLGTTYVDDHVTKAKSPIHIAPMYAMGALGPVLGFVLGAVLLQYYVDIFSIDFMKLKINPNDPQWIGAWWTGFLICGTIFFFVSIPFFTFPKRMKLELEKKALGEKLNRPEKVHELLAEPEQTASPYGKNIKDIPKSMWKLCKNPVYMLICLGSSCEIAIVSGFVVFLSKYLETQFGISNYEANLFTGCVAIPGAFIGIIVGGYIYQKFNFSTKGALQMTLILGSITLALFAVLFFLGCDNPKFAGATRPYFNSSGHQQFEANLTSTCNIDCDCSHNDIEPICGINGMTYFSPCHAGCKQFIGSEDFDDKEKLTNYSHCKCISDLSEEETTPEVLMSPLARSGPCKMSCRTLAPFMVVLFFMVVAVSATQIPLLMLTMRSVNEEERSFALGMQFIIFRFFGYIPAPIMFGNVIDTTCLLWRKQCNINGNCLMYDIVNFRYKYLGVTAGLKFVAMMFFLSVWIIVKTQLKNNSDGAMAVDSTAGNGRGPVSDATTPTAEEDQTQQANPLNLTKKQLKYLHNRQLNSSSNDEGRREVRDYSNDVYGGTLA
ncbi:unnamed protein product [Owenia fusiformis]|nr:unnamed protein product [Owenia fusiformis]